jgi:hypothetical protein
MVLEKNGKILFVKKKASPGAQEIGCSLNAQETLFLRKLCPKYSLLCLNAKGVLSAAQKAEFSLTLKSFDKIIMMGSDCSKAVGLPHRVGKFIIDGGKTIHATHSLTNLMGSKIKSGELKKTLSEFHREKIS